MFLRISLTSLSFPLPQPLTVILSYTHSGQTLHSLIVAVKEGGRAYCSRGQCLVTQFSMRLERGHPFRKKEGREGGVAAAGAGGGVGWGVSRLPPCLFLSHSLSLCKGSMCVCACVCMHVCEKLLTPLLKSWGVSRKGPISKMRKAGRHTHTHTPSQPPH